MKEIVAGIALLIPSTPRLCAHHSFAAEFDASKPVVLRGQITKVAWTNPHVYFWIDAADGSGKTTNWTIESVAPNYLVRLGLTKQSIKPGDWVTIRAFVAKDRTNLAKTDSITLPGGRIVTTGRADDGGSR